jgi:hypothetical protein
MVGRDGRMVVGSVEQEDGAEKYVLELKLLAIDVI